MVFDQLRSEPIELVPVRNKKEFLETLNEIVAFSDESELQKNMDRLPQEAVIPLSILSKLATDAREIFRFLVQGKTAKELAAALDVSVRTFHYRKKAIFNSLGVTNRTELIELIRLTIENDSKVDSSNS